MSKGFLFWLLMILWLVLSLYIGWGAANYMLAGQQLLAFALFFLLGWHCFGFIVQ